MSFLDDLKTSVKSVDTLSKSSAFDEAGVPSYIFEDYYRDDMDVVVDDIDYYLQLLKKTVNDLAGYNVPLMDFSQQYNLYLNFK